MPAPRSRPHLAALLLASTALPVLPAVARAEDRAIQVLLDQANYWRGQGRTDQVIRALERVLAADPDNVAALSGLAQAQAQQGDRAAADRTLARLRQVAPGNSVVGSTETQLRGASADPAQVAEARRLAQAGQNAAAVARYRQIFGGSTPPDVFAQEYYQAQAGTPDGYAQGRDGLKRLLDRNPGNRALQLALAQVLTWREGSRTEGIRLLQQLAGSPDMAQQARNSWRQALSWDGASASAIPGLEAYLERYPDDQQAQRQLAEARNPARTPQDEMGTRRQAGFEALNGNRVAAAEAAFQAVLQQAPEDSDALGGLGLVRLRQGRSNEAKTLLARAIAADPQEGRRKWGQALDGASYAGAVNTARSQIARGQVQQAEATLEAAVRQGGAEQAEAQALLGDILLRRGDAAGAEKRYRAALSRRPNLPGALSGLYQSLQSQGRMAEAEELAARQGGAFANSLAASRAEQLRAEAQRSADPAQAVALLQSAYASNPEDPWVRLDLARAMARQGRGAEGRALMQELVQRSASADNLYAAGLFAQEEGRASEAAALIERIPLRLRSADASRLLRATAVQAEVAAAAEPARYGQYDLARQRLMQIVARPDPAGETAAQAVRALNAVGDTRGAVELARMALATNANAALAGRIALADALLDAGQGGEAAALAASLAADPRLTAQDRQRLGGLQTGIAIRESDRLNEAGDQAAAYDRLAPALSAKPQDPDVNLALARLYQGAQDPARAQEVAEAVLRRDPRNADARLAAASAAIARGQTRRAEELLAEGRTLTPNDPRVAVVEAQLARASGDSRRAQAALQRAEELRRAQLSGTPASVPMAPGPAATMRGQATANPFQQVALAGGEPVLLAAAGPAVGNDPLLNDIQRQLAEVREESAPRIGPNFAGRFRSGSGGLDRLQEYSGGAEASAAMPGIGGRIAARAQLYSIDSGTLDQSTGNLRRFGTNPLRLPGPSESISAATAARLTPKDTTASGVAFGLGYTRGESLSLDVGSTPIGYRVQNLVGGLELAPSLNGNLRLRLTGERRAMTDSLLAWAGQRDPVTSRTWGGVVRNTGRGQFEWSAGPANFYAGGGYSQVEGKGVADNNRIEAGAGMSYAFFRRPDEELTSGLDLVYLSYDKNLRFFTLGQGGYFSPQNYVAANIPIDYRARLGNLSYHLGGQIGLAHFKEDRSPLFPNDPALQARAEAREAADSTQSAFYAGQTQTSLVGGVRADAEYAITPQFKVGGLLRYDRAAEWNEVRAMLFARYRFD